MLGWAPFQQSEDSFSFLARVEPEAASLSFLQNHAQKERAGVCVCVCVLMRNDICWMKCPEIKKETQTAIAAYAIFVEEIGIAVL
jgi:hypothetical protein